MDIKVKDCDSVRGNMLLVATFGMIVGIAAILVYGPSPIDVETKGALLLLLGSFGKSVSTAIDFEFGSSRSAATKDATIAKAVDASASTASAADTTATTVAASLPK
jgi:hypothetical protein